MKIIRIYAKVIKKKNKSFKKSRRSKINSIQETRLDKILKEDLVSLFKGTRFFKD